VGFTFGRWRQVRQIARNLDLLKNLKNVYYLLRGKEEICYHPPLNHKMASRLSIIDYYQESNQFLDLDKIYVNTLTSHSTRAVNESPKPDWNHNHSKNK